MSEPISAIGGKAQAPPAPSAPHARPQAQQAQAPQAASVAEPKQPAAAAAKGAAAENAAGPNSLNSPAAGAGAEKTTAAAEQNGPAAQGRDESNPKALEEKQPVATKQQTQEALQSFMEYVDKLPGDMKFTVDEDTNRQVFKIVNPITQEVVKQFPPDEFLTMVKRLKELGSPSEDNGIFFDERS